MGVSRLVLMKENLARVGADEMSGKFFVEEHGF